MEAATAAKGARIRIGDLLKERGYVTDAQIAQALEYQKSHKGVRLGTALIHLGFISEDQMLGALAERLGIRRVSMAGLDVDVSAAHRIPKALAEKYCLLGVSAVGGVLTVAVNDPVDFFAIEDIRQVTGMHIETILCKRAELEAAIRHYYAEVDAIRATEKANVASAAALPAVPQIEVEEGSDDTPVIGLLSTLVRRAYTTGASDIHIEPFEDKSIVRMRTDGTIIEYVTLQQGLQAPLIARIKILSDLNIAERRLPQDGHFRIKVDTDVINIRVSVIPTVFGEKAVLRLLASNAVIQNPGSYGMQPDAFEKFSHMLRSPHGIIYLTGPTGSGKTTTLYMVLESMSAKRVNISTIEDPVEKNLPRVNQMQVNNTSGLTFETGLRALLRQDPDIIMVGETRDAETASISVRAAITGHLVFSTLHTNDAVSSIIRLQDMGIEAYMVASSLVGIVAQRLVRRLCPECAQEYDAEGEELAFLNLDHARLKRPVGCPLCGGTGYRGRMAIHEVLVIDKTIRRMITSGASMDTIGDYARKQQGMRLLRESGTELVLNRLTSMEELMRIAYYSD